MTPIECPAQYEPAMTDSARLLKLLGKRKFTILQEVFGGRRIWIPKAGARPDCSTCARRDRCIVEWRQQKRPVDSIARHLGVSPKTVYRVLER
ncbi:MAG: helix-turn-helix domain-containing protein [Elusimicrobia bacterium]|nr:helix-turn-helix domain-containing protein [Elusimicrobiota bacterium]